MECKGRVSLGYRQFLWWSAGVWLALQPSGCECDPETVAVVECDFTVETPDPNDSVLFRETAVGDERNRSIRIVNRGNIVLSDFTFTFAERNGQHYRMGDEAADLRIDPEGTGTARVFFAPLAVSPGLNGALTISHPSVREVGCPARAISLEGASFETFVPEDAGSAEGDAGNDAGIAQDAGAPDAGLADAGDLDAGPVVPPDAGVPLEPGAFFSARGALQEARSAFASVVLPDATLLAIGGYGEMGQALSSIERFDPRTGRSRIVAHTRVARAAPGAVLLPDGKVAIVGGRTRAVGGLAATTLEIFDPEDDSVSCPGTQGTCSLQDIAQGQGVLPEGRIDPIVVAPNAQPGVVVVAFGRTLDDSGQEVNAAGAFHVPVSAVTGASVVDGSELALPRRDEVRVVHPSGAFLALGGQNDQGAPVASTVVYDPSVGRFATFTTDPPPRFRIGGAGVLLTSEDVLVLAGTDAFGVPVAAERLRDPFGLVAEQDAAVEDVAGLDLETRFAPELTQVGGDFLLLAGGMDRNLVGLDVDESRVPRADADLLVPLGASWFRVSPDNQLATPRFAHRAHLVSWVDEDTEEEEVAVVYLGGSATAPRRTPHPAAERYRFSQNAFEVYGLMGTGSRFAANAPADLYSLGGKDPHTGAISARVRSFSTLTDRFEEQTPLDVPRQDHAVGLLDDDNTFLIAGGRDGAGQVLATASLYNPFNAFDEPLSATLNRARANPSVNRLVDGRILLCGGIGSGGEILDTCEVFVPPPSLLDPSSYGDARFELVEGRMSTGRHGHTATFLPDTGEVLLVGGGDPERDQVTADLYVAANDRILATALPNRARRDHVAVHLGSGRVLIAGGEIYAGGYAAAADAEVYERWNEIFIPVANEMAKARIGAFAVPLLGGDVLIFGGAEAGTNGFPTRSLKQTELYVPGPNGVGSFTSLPDLSLRYGRSNLAPGEIFGRGLAAGGNHRDGWLENGDERRTPLYFLEKLVHPDEETPGAAAPSLDGGPADGG